MRQGVLAALVVTLVVALSLSLVGCALQTGLDTTVNEDGSGTIGITLSADKELQDALQGAGAGLGDIGPFFEGLRNKIPTDVELLFRLILGSIPTEWKVERGTDSDGTMWIRVWRPFDSPDHLQQVLTDGVLSAFVDADQFQLSQDEGFFRTRTIFHTVADLEDLLDNVPQGNETIPMQLLGQVLKVENRLTLPGTIKDHNADRVDGNTLVWDVLTSGDREMFAGSVMYRWGRIIGIAVAAFVVVVLLVVLLILLIRRRRRRKQEIGAEAGLKTEAPDTFPAGAGPPEQGT